MLRCCRVCYNIIREKHTHKKPEPAGIRFHLLQARQRRPEARKQTFRAIACRRLRSKPHPDEGSGKATRRGRRTVPTGKIGHIRVKIRRRRHFRRIRNKGGDRICNAAEGGGKTKRKRFGHTPAQLRQNAQSDIGHAQFRLAAHDRENRILVSGGGSCVPSAPPAGIGKRSC